MLLHSDKLAILALLAASVVTAEQIGNLELPVPTRQLEWGDVNFLSTSDTHGWLLGHQHATWPEPNYSGDFGDFVSFSTHLSSIADTKGVDLLLVDAGDHHDGSGLVSSSDSSATRADDIFSMLRYDVATIGNHELYQYESAKQIYDKREEWEGRYLTSNVNITVWEDGKAVSKPIGERVRKFETKQGKKVTAFGVIFDFPKQAHDRNLTVHSPTLMSREAWFLEAIDEAPDFFLLVGHMPGRGETAEWAPLYDAIRAKHPKAPVFVFGGHTHERDCVQYDDRSIAVVPGRYMETIAFTSSSLPTSEKDVSSLKMARRYIDASRRSYMFHTNTSSDTFDTTLGKKITLELLRLSSKLNISIPLGKAPHDFFLTRYPYGHEKSVVTQWTDKVIPYIVVDPTRSEKHRVIMVMSGSLRFDIFQGRFDRNDELTVSPFANAFVYTELPAGLARNITQQMNLAGPSKLVPSQAPSTRQEVEDRVDQGYRAWMASQWEDYLQSQSQTQTETNNNDVQMSFDVTRMGKGKKSPTLGYVTKDACPGLGDDIEHIPVPFSKDSQPSFVETPFPEVDDDEIIDVVNMDFSLDDFLAAVNVLDPERKLTAREMRPYAPGVDMKSMWGRYAAEFWR
ncbi:vacuolar protein [Naematelia encephala]|uniref:Vacuolar protein n=1 Tax=Naematelia encephala TaxID=71784 RepID=A0A1Y2ATQ9_9TREE|nr:vacuolar protein [Naematelia encephala]